MIIAVVNQKGGTGKTTTTVNLGACLANQGKKVLLVDLDAQGSLSYSLGIGEVNKSIANVLLEDLPIRQILVDYEGLSVAPASIDLADAELSMTGMENREMILKEKLSGTSEFDFILVDCPPSLSLLTLNALTAAQHVIIPMQMEVLSLQGLDLITETIGKVRQVLNPDLSILGVLPVMVDKRRKLSSEVLNHIKENYDFKVFDSQIRTNVKASEAPSFGQSVLHYAPTSNSAKDYKTFTQEFLNLN
ncbi:MAG: ParA family protein [Cyclobacteriaceae bacterium]|nr:ParA family protein [Cyclobacteriaceae bacterium HetDA_MAG_MS6]